MADPDTSGPIGAPILPRALLGTAIPASDAALAITGSGLATPDASMYPFDWFLGYDYPFYEEQTPNPDGNTYYVVILNVTGPQCAAGIIKASKPGRDWLIPESSLEAYQSRGQN